MIETTKKMNSVPEVPIVPVGIVNGLSFGGWLKLLLARSGVTQRVNARKITYETLAAECGLKDVRQVNKWVSDRQFPPESRFNLLFKALEKLTGNDPAAVAQRDHLRTSWKIYDELRSDKRDRRRELRTQSKAETFSSNTRDLQSSAENQGRFDVSKIAHFAPSVFVGRENEMEALTAIWHAECRSANQPTRIIEFDAFGGEGKSSLVSHWIRERQKEGLPADCRIFAWSFWSQGSKDQLTAARAFLDAALLFFGEVEHNLVGRDDIVKGKALAKLLDRKKSLIILDGLEPLQFPPSTPSPGRLKDQGIASFLTALAANAAGLCIATSRIRLTDLQGFYAANLHHIRLPALSTEESVRLLQLQTLTQPNGTDLKLKGTHQAFIHLATHSAGHALSLTLVASYLLLAHKGDIRKSDVIEFRRADEESADGQAFRIMAAYVRWFERDHINGVAAVSVLRILGLFDRPADKVLLDALTAGPEIQGVTDALPELDHEAMHILFNRLANAQLISLVFDDDQESTLLRADTHPLIREYFSEEMQSRHPDGYKLAHGRLFGHLQEQASKATSSEQLDLLYQAVLHGCQADQRQLAFDRVFWPLISKGKMHYSVSQFGAVNDDLAVLAGFFKKRWKIVAPGLTARTQAQIRSMCGFRLRTAGRFGEAAPLIQEALKYYEGIGNHEEAAAEAGNLTVLCLNAGRLKDARAYAELSVRYAKRTENKRLWITGGAALGDVLVQQGHRAHSRALRIFAEAERTQKALDKKRPLLHSTKGYRYFELLLDLRKHDEVLKRISVCEKWTTAEYRRLDTGLYLLMKGRALLARARQRQSSQDQVQAAATLEAALVALTASGFQENIVRGLLALVDCLSGKREENWQLLQDRLNEAWEIAGRGPMMLFRADILLMRAALFGGFVSSTSNRRYPWPSRYSDLANARKIIRECGYGRREGQLSALSKVAVSWSKE